MQLYKPIIISIILYFQVHLVMIIFYEKKILQTDHSNKIDHWIYLSFS